MSEQPLADSIDEPLSPEEERSLVELIERLRSTWRIGQRVIRKRVDTAGVTPAPQPLASKPDAAWSSHGST